MSKAKKILAMLCCVLLLASLLVGCGSKEKKLVGSWYNEGGSLAFVFYSDGTCEISNTYGTGKWSVLEDDLLKIVDFYGQTVTAEISELDGDSMELDFGFVTSTYYKK